MTDSPIHDVPQASILIPVMLAGLAIVGWRLNQPQRFTWARAATGVVACVYGVGALREVLQPFQLGIDRRYYLGWRVFVHLTPLIGAEPIDLALNAVLFMPLGVLIPLLMRVRSVVRIGLIATWLSITIELLQLLLDVVVSVGRVADVNDVLGDVIGAVTGYAIFWLLWRTATGNRALSTFTWPAIPRNIGRGHGAAALHRSEKTWHARARP